MVVGDRCFMWYHRVCCCRREDQSRNVPLATSGIVASKRRRRYEASKACRSRVSAAALDLAAVQLDQTRA